MWRSRGFHSPSVQSLVVLDLIAALGEYGYYGLRWFFDENGVFHFGVFDDTGKNGGGEYFAFEKGKNIYEYWSDFTGSAITVEAVPIRHSQEITVDGRPAVTLKSDLLVSARVARLALWFMEVP
jgi:hypothetical protein